jgi:hypothetical protein
MKTTTLALMAATSATALLANSVQAASLDNFGALSGAEFRLLSEDLGAAVSYKPMIPSEGLGVLGFDIGVGITGTSLEHRDILSKAAGGSSVPKLLPVGTLRAHKGLPFDIDVGLVLGSVAGTDAKLAGGELRWAFIGGNTLMPAVALRAAISNVNGVDDFKLDTTSVDLSISKGFLMLTPYAGIGKVRVKSKYSGSGVSYKESFNQDKLFGGVNINLGLMNIALEADKTGDASSYGVKLGLRF